MKKLEIVDKLNDFAKSKTPNADVYHLEDNDSIILEYDGVLIAEFRGFDYNDFCVVSNVMNKDFPLLDFVEDESKTGLLYWFYTTGTRLLKKFKNRKYSIKVLKGNAENTIDSAYLNVNGNSGDTMFSTKKNYCNWRASFTKDEIEKLKKRDDIAIDWNKVELDEVDDDE